MRNPTPFHSIGLLAFFAFSFSSFAQLPSRSELVLQKYEKDRAKGIAALNKRYIAAFEKSWMWPSLQNSWKKPTQYSQKIQTLKAEAEELSKPKVTKVNSTEAITNDPNFLVGKRLGVPFAHDPKKTAYYSFQADGKALWLGLRNQKIERAYKPTGQAREFLLWWPGRPDGFGTLVINIAPDGKTATVTEKSKNETVNGIIEDDD